MRWLERSVLLCLAMVVLTPAPAHAWFEWLDYLSGPGRFYGVKADLRVHCFGREVPFSTLETRLEQVLNNPQDPRAFSELLDIQKKIGEINLGLNVVEPSKLAAQEQRVRAAAAQPQVLRDEAVVALADLRALQKTSVAFASGGIFVSLCSRDKIRTFAIEAGFTGMGTGGNVNYANNEKIWMTMLTWGLSYRVPLSVDHDVVDLGTNVGMYTFYSKGFENFSGFTIEPFVDFHLPTRFLLDDSKKWNKFFGRFTVRAGLVYFPGGFKAEQFASGPGKGDISGSEATPSLTIFYNLRP